MILSIEGEEKTGKTTLAYTAPLKIVGFQFDLGAERALMGLRYNEFFKDLTVVHVSYDPKRKTFQDLWAKADIVIFELPAPVQIDSTRVHGVKELWDYFLAIIGEAIRDPLVRSLVMDTMTLARRVKADAYLQALQEVERSSQRVKLLQIEYGAPNGAIRDLFSACKSIRKNLTAVHHLTDEYGEVNKVLQDKVVSERVRTGRRVLEGIEQTYRYVDVALRMEKRGKELIGRVVSCGYALELEGMELPNPTWDSLVTTIGMTIEDRIQFERRNT